MFNEISQGLKILGEKIKHLEKSEHFKRLEFNYYEKEYIDNVKLLLNYLINLSSRIASTFNKKMSVLSCEEILTLLNSSESRKFVNEKIESINKYLDSDDKKRRFPKTDNEHHEFECNKYYLDSLKELFKAIRLIRELVEDVIKRNVHVIGKAGLGKTNLACSVVEKMLKSGLPALLLLGSELQSESNIRKQILESFEVSGSFTFSEFLGALDNLGFLKNSKVPIVIDGINETTPTASVWARELFYLMQDVSRFQNLIVISTCRESYIEQIFHVQDYNDIKNGFYIEGFDDQNINDVIERYFLKYDIRITNENYDKNLLKNPLFLKIFCKTNRGKRIKFDLRNVYQAIDNYLSVLIRKMSIQNNIKNPVLEKQIQNSVSQFSKRIWETNNRGLPYPEEFVGIFDPDYDSKNVWTNTNSYKLIDEGLCISRKMIDGKEKAEFTYDLLGGFSIAKSVFFDGLSGSEIIKKLQSKESIKKLLGTDRSAHRHPLYEDILGSIIYLLPKHFDKELFQILNNDIVVKHSITLIELITSLDKGRESFSEFTRGINQDSANLSYLFGMILKSILLRNDYDNISILIENLLRLDGPWIDLHWSELIRKNSREIIGYLDDVFLMVNQGEQRNQDDVVNTMNFIGVLLSSTNRFLRDKATKTLFEIGIKYPNELFTVFKNLRAIKDIYIFDRLISVLCGVFLQIENKDLTLVLAEYLDENFHKKLITSHILILDYINSIIDFASEKYGYKSSYRRIHEQDLGEWLQDEECKKKITGDGEAAWGYGPIHLDFSKYVIGGIARYSQESKTPTLKECLAMVIWRMKQLGYSEKLFIEFDKEIMKDQPYSRHKRYAVERYGKKYSWIAFYELCGYFMIKKLFEGVYENTLRVSSVDIDPTFPEKPPKFQLLTNCFFPAYNENVQDWINSDKSNYLGDLYIHNFDDSNLDWILLNAHLVQKGGNDTRIDIFVNGLLIGREFTIKFMEFLDKNMPYLYIPKYYYLFGGEIPWSVILDPEDQVVEIGKIKIGIQFPYLLYTWESYHSSMNDIGDIPFVTTKIARDLKLVFNVRNFSFYTEDGKIASKYVWDDYSDYLYIRGDLLTKYLKKHDLTLVWYESGTRFGEFGKTDHKLAPSLKDFKSTRFFIPIDEVRKSEMAGGQVSK